MNRRRTGTFYERKAEEYLKAEGYVILERNYRAPGGEIDLVAEEEGYLVFVEVKFRKDSEKGNALEAVDRGKQRAIIKTARYYLMEHGNPGDCPCRFDVVGITGQNITLLRNAFFIEER